MGIFSFSTIRTKPSEEFNSSRKSFKEIQSSLTVTPSRWKRKTQYLPHHSVKNASKPSKVFGCSANYGGISLKNLTNHLAVVIIRFLPQEVAFMGDIEATYHQKKS